MMFTLTTAAMVGVRYLRLSKTRSFFSKTRPLVVTISGATRSGKSELTRNLKERLVKTNCCTVTSIHLDDYRAYTLGGVRVVDEHGRRNWETPNNINFEVLLRDVKDSIEKKKCVDVLLLEGFCVLEKKRVRKMSHVVFHLDISRDQCRERRRRSKYSHPKKDWTFDQYFDEVIWPAHMKYKNRVYVWYSRI